MIQLLVSLKLGNWIFSSYAGGFQITIYFGKRRVTSIVTTKTFRFDITADERFYMLPFLCETFHK